MNQKKVSLVIPMYYEELVVEECYRRVKEILIRIADYEHGIIFINMEVKIKLWTF